MNDCHSHAVRASRAMLLSEKRRSSPPRGDMTSPTVEPLPGKSVPVRSVSTKNCASNALGVESNGVPWEPDTRGLSIACQRRGEDGCSQG